VRRFSYLYAWIRRGAVVNDMPVACQSRGTARPQAGESTLLHHHPVERLDDFLSLAQEIKNRKRNFLRENAYIRKQFCFGCDPFKSRSFFH